MNNSILQLRDAFIEERRRLKARPHEGGPMFALRNGTLLVWLGDAEVEFTGAMLEKIMRLPADAGPRPALWALGLVPAEVEA